MNGKATQTKETTMSNPNPIDIQTQLAHLLDLRYKATKAYYVERLSNIADRAPVFYISKGGRKYLRIVSDDGSQKTVVCFVEKATGTIWKAASWKGPELNFPRGSIFDEEPGYEFFKLTVDYAKAILAAEKAPAETNLQAQLVAFYEDEAA